MDEWNRVRHLTCRCLCASGEHKTVLPRTKVDDSLFGDQRWPALDEAPYPLSPVSPRL